MNAGMKLSDLIHKTVTTVFFVILWVVFFSFSSLSYGQGYESSDRDHQREVFQNEIVSNVTQSTADKMDTESVNDPTDIPNLLTFWDFQEPAGTDRISVGRYEYGLVEMNGTIERVEDGIFGLYSADFKWGQWFRIKRQNAQGLDLHGEGQQVSMVAWVKRESDRVWQFIAGMWNEGDERYKGQTQASGEGAPARQYAMFISGAWQSDYTTYERTRAEHQPMGYISPYGGATPEHPFAFDYATGGTRLEQDRWYMIAYTFDGEAIRVYVNGKLDENGNYNPFLYDGSIHDGGENGSDFTVAQRDHPKWPSYPKGTPNYNEGFDGRIGGLAVYDCALTQEEIKKLYKATML